MVAIIKTGQTPEVGKGALAQDEMLKIINFCKKFDIVDGDIKPDSPYVFDVRPEAVHLLDSASKEIITSMYLDREKGNMSIEVEQAEGSLNPDVAVHKWASVITDALRG